jgi:hypothetical protein
MDSSEIYQFGIRAPRETSLETRTTPWMFYRHDDSPGAAGASGDDS